MAGKEKTLAGMFDGGPHEDPREAEAEELINDGEEEEEKVEEDNNAEFEEEEAEEEKPEVTHDDEDEEKEEAEADKEAEAKEEKPVEEEKASEEEKEDPKTKYQTIPYQRFRKELTKRHAMATELARTQSQLEDLKNRLADFEKAAGKAADPEPDKDIYPLEHTQWQVRQLQAQLNQKKEEPQTGPFISDRERPVLMDFYRESVDAYKEEKADFDDAYAYAINATAARLAAQNPKATQDQITAAVQHLELQEVRFALNASQDPAERIYQIATQLGYRAKMTENSAKAVVEDKVKAAADEAARRSRARTAVGKGVTINKRPLTEDDIEGMSNEELTKFMNRNSGRTNPLRP